jgi:hypothetical protein
MFDERGQMGVGHHAAGARTGKQPRHWLRCSGPAAGSRRSPGRATQRRESSLSGRRVRDDDGIRHEPDERQRWPRHADVPVVQPPLKPLTGCLVSGAWRRGGVTRRFASTRIFCGSALSSRQHLFDIVEAADATAAECHGCTRYGPASPGARSAHPARGAAPVHNILNRTSGSWPRPAAPHVLIQRQRGSHALMLTS